MTVRTYLVGILSLAVLTCPMVGESTDSDLVTTLRAEGFTSITEHEAQYLTVLSRGMTTDEAGQFRRQVLLFHQAGLDLKEAGMAADLAGLLAQAEAAEARNDEAEKSFLGIDWGMGISASFDLDSKSRVETAEVVNNAVRVNKESDTALGVVLDAHYFWPLRRDGQSRPMVGVGPFVAIQTSGDNLIDSWALGGMFGFRRDATKSTSFNLGLGLRIEPDVQVLGDGLVGNQTLPDGETEIRYKTEDRIGIVVVFSASF